MLLRTGANGADEGFGCEVPLPLRVLTLAKQPARIFKAIRQATRETRVQGGSRIQHRHLLLLLSAGRAYCKRARFVNPRRVAVARIPLCRR